MFSELTKSSATADTARVVHHKPYCQKLDSLNYVFVADSMGLALVSWTYSYSSESCHIV